jgi:hypothetical protein
VNRSKTKAVVFGAQLQKARHWEATFYIDGGAIETVGSYRYIRVEARPSRAGGRQQCRPLSPAGRRATHALRQRCTEIQLYDPGLRAELFDSLVRPIMLHGAKIEEIWGATRQIGLTRVSRDLSN